MKDHFADSFDEGVYAICITCGIYVVPVAKHMQSPDMMPACDCGYDHDKIVANIKKAMAEEEAKETKAVDEKTKTEESTAENAWPLTAHECNKITKKISVVAMFREKIHPAVVNYPEKWDETVFGKTYAECIVKYVAKYELSANKTGYLDQIRKLDDPEEIIDKLKEQMTA